MSHTEVDDPVQPEIHSDTADSIVSTGECVSPTAPVTAASLVQAPQIGWTTVNQENVSVEIHEVLQGINLNN